MSGLYGVQPSASDAGGSSASAGANVAPGSGSNWWSAIPVVGPVVDIVSSILGIESQKQANRMNYAIQQQTNAMNYQMFQEQQKFAWDMWKSTNKYNSPAHQRELMQAAGYNPNMIFGYNQGAASNISSPTPNGAQIGNPMQATLSPTDIANNLSSGMNAAAALSESRLKDAQATGQRIDNLYNARVKEAELRLRNQESTARAIENEVAFDTAEDKKAAVRLQNENVKQDTIKKATESAVNRVLERYHDAKVDEVRESINYLLVQQDVARATELMQQALGSKYLAEKELAEIQKDLAPGIAASQMAANYASAEASKGMAAQGFSQAEVNKKTAAYQGMINDVYKVFGKGKAAQDFLNSMAQGNLTYWQTHDFYQAAKEKEIFNNYEDMHKWLRNANDAMDFIKSFTEMFSPGPSGVPRYGK